MSNNFENTPPSPEEREKPLNEQNWKILKSAESSLVRQINELTGKSVKMPTQMSERSAAFEQTRELAIKLVTIRQMMRAEVQSPDLEFEEVDDFVLYPHSLSEER